MEENELKELHNRLSKLCDQNTFSAELRKVLHKIVDKMWSQNDNYVWTEAGTAVSKTTYIYHYLKNISKIYKVYEEEMARSRLDNKGNITIIPAVVDKMIESKIILRLTKGYFEEGEILAHELGHLQIPQIKILCFKGGFSLHDILEEGNAEKNPLKKIYNFHQNLFLYTDSETGQEYSFSIPQTGTSPNYVVNTAIYFQLKAILAKEDFKDILEDVEKDRVENAIQKIYNITGNKALAEKYLMIAFNTLETYPYGNSTKLKMESNIEESMKKNITLNYLEEQLKEEKSKNSNLLDRNERSRFFTYMVLYQNTLYFTKYPEKKRQMKDWNQKLENYRKTHTSFEENYITLQKTFFDVMAKKVERATSVEEVYQILRNIKFINESLPTVRNAKGKDITNSQIGILRFKYVTSNKIARLQEQTNCSIIPLKKEESKIPTSGTTPYDEDAR